MPPKELILFQQHLLCSSMIKNLYRASSFFQREGSVSAALQDAKSSNKPKLTWKPSSISRKESKNQYYKDLCKQVEEKRQQEERERSRNLLDDQKHNETMQHVWVKPGSGAPNYHLGTMRRTKSLYNAGILPQEQIRDRGFSGIPFHHP